MDNMKNKPEFQRIQLNPNFPVTYVEMNSQPDIDLFYCHWHPNIEIIYVDKGTISMKIDTQDFQLNTGDICIINPNQVHYGISANNTYCSVKLLVISYDILSMELNNPIYERYIEPLNSGRLLLPNVIPHISTKKDTPTWQLECHQSISKLLSCISQDYIGKELAIQSSFLMLLATLYRSDKLIGKAFIQNKTLSTREMNILNYLEEHFTESISIPVLASHFHVSEDYFYKLFKKITGQTPIKYILQLKIQYAKQLLKTTDISISDIGFQIGFESTSYFSKTFKKLTGFTPMTYRKIIQ
ncbi:AraC-type DNA-binding protein [Clostridium grantii DSM 8605]|uniref:AraC-type DNA-binding protein n=2 Tax=Clostridium TaxID=1485 RepID=A0A1M5WQA4_9CLOT|nr:AraC-type DNA-binding protein [Clostridium grantii DSM 8605]